MNSCIYITKLAHERLTPVKNSFKYSIYMMYLDLDELESVNKKTFLFSYNKWNVFSFFDKDHFKFINKDTSTSEIISRENINYDVKKYIGKNTKERIKTLVDELNLDFTVDKIFVLTNVRIFGYIFNPVSFYYCFDKDAKLKVMFSEVNNTFHDQKMYYTVIDNPEETVFRSRQRKNYYISPFISYDNDLSWQFQAPGDKLVMAINSLKNDQIELKTLLLGTRLTISNINMLWLQIRYPLLTLMIIVLIHYQAIKLIIKKVAFFRKEETDKKIAETIINKQ